MMIVQCPSCQKSVSLDENKLPMREVAFPCPGCQTRIAVDRRTQGAGREDLLDPNAMQLGEKALIVGAEDQAVDEACRAIGYLPHHVSSAEEGRNFFSP